MPHCRSRFNLREGPAAPLPGGSLPLGAKIRLKINFIYIKVPTTRQEGGRAPLPPDSRGINL